MGIIRVNAIHVRAFHGCMAEEAVIGGNYIVDITIETDFSEAAAADDLSLTVDYVVVSRIVHEEMAIRSKLIETVAERIATQLKCAFPQVASIRVKVTKLAAPIPGQVESVSVETVR